MGKISFERVITHFENERDCILLMDREGKEYGDYFQTDYCILKTPDGKRYKVEVADFYYKNRFVKGLNCRTTEDETQTFTFEQSANPGHWVRLTFDPDAPLEDNAMVVDAEVFVKTA